MFPFPSPSDLWEFSFPNSSLQLEGGNESQETLGATSWSCRGRNSRHIPLFPINGARSWAQEKSGRKIHEIFSGCAELTQLFRALRHGASMEQGRTLGWRPDTEIPWEWEGFLLPIPVGIFPGGSVKALGIPRGKVPSCGVAG